MYNINIYFYYIYLNGEFNTFRIYKMYRKIQIKVKLEAIKYSKSNNNQKAVGKFGISTKTIRNWRLNDNKIRNVNNQNRRITLNPGPSANRINFKLEKEIYNYLGNIVARWSIEIEMIRRDPNKIYLKLNYFILLFIDF